MTTDWIEERTQATRLLLQNEQFTPSERLVILAMHLTGFTMTASAIIGITQGSPEHIRRIINGLVRRGTIKESKQSATKGGREIKTYLLKVPELPARMAGPVSANMVLEIFTPGLWSELEAAGEVLTPAVKADLETWGVL